MGEPWVERLDLDSGELADPSFVSDKHDNRENDIVWRFRRKDGGEPADVYILDPRLVTARERSMLTRSSWARARLPWCRSRTRRRKCSSPAPRPRAM